MLDRETRILEMAKDMCFHADSCTVGAENKCCTLNCETTWAAEKLVNKNYQKVDPDSVVLPKKEYEALLGELHALTYKYDKLLDDYRLCKDANETIKQNYIMVKRDTEQQTLKFTLGHILGLLSCIDFETDNQDYDNGFFDGTRNAAIIVRELAKLNKVELEID
jgi:hypothetical protein